MAVLFYGGAEEGNCEDLKVGYDGRMIGTDQVINGVGIGLVLIFLGLVPGLYQSLAEGLANCASFLSTRFRFLRWSCGELEQPRWFAAVGVGVISLTFLAYYAR
jgi:hypothetical protein